MIVDYLAAKKVGGRHVGRPASAKTIKAYDAALMLCERLIDVPLEDWTFDEGDALLEALEEVSPAYKANILSALRGYYAWAIGVGRYKGQSPISGISSPHIPRKIPTILTKDQVKEFFSHFDGKYKLFFELMYYGGLRIGEVASLRREDVRDEALVIRGKGNKQRYIYLSDSLYHRLLAHMQENNDSDYVFYGDSANACKDQPITLVTARETFNRIRDQMGLKIRPHNLRHTSATHFHESVGDLALTSKFLGHSRPETTMIYAQIADSRMKHATKSVFG
jgi:integrase